MLSCRLAPNFCNGDLGWLHNGKVSWWAIGPDRFLSEQCMGRGVSRRLRYLPRILWDTVLSPAMCSTTTFKAFAARKNHYCPLSLPLCSTFTNQSLWVLCINTSEPKYFERPLSIQVWHGLMFPLHAFCLWFFNCVLSASASNTQILSLHRTHWQVLSARTFPTCST